MEGGATFGKLSLFAYAGFDNSYEYSEGQEGFFLRAEIQIQTSPTYNVQFIKQIQQV
ncbi:hypothetical protein [Chryseobacterium indoltheticum]|uniref:hypothetical protein n=1 Tax=Chryseobacterium indoltheticum TaxID=254 RepID=UPI003F49758E